jgi:hypothetical protein
VTLRWCDGARPPGTEAVGAITTSSERPDTLAAERHDVHPGRWAAVALDVVRLHEVFVADGVLDHCDLAADAGPFAACARPGSVGEP